MQILKSQEFGFKGFGFNLLFKSRHSELLKKRAQLGSILIYNIIIIFIFSLVLLGVLAYAAIQLRVIRSSVSRELAFQVAEAGVNYYQWRLAHFPDDYWDGNATSTPGPYVHEYYDTDTNQKVGEFSLEIIEPPVGSTIVTIVSTGHAVENPNIKRAITVKYGRPSLAKYAFLTNNDVWIGDTESVSGQLHANGGIRFDGSGDAPITSSKNDRPVPGPGYQCYSYHGCNSPWQWKPGIWGIAPASTQAFWQMSVPNVPFSSITSDFQSIELLAQGQANLPPSTRQGYSLVFKINGTIDVYKVYSLRSHQTGYDVNNVAHSENLDYNSRVFQYNMPMPANGVIFVKDHVWVEGVVNGRVVVAATKYTSSPSSQARILIPDNLTYLAKDGSHSLGLIAERDILITYFAPSDLEINAAMIAQNGSAQRYYFPGNTKNSISIYGSTASFGVWTWSWVDGSGNCTSGYCNTSTVYDANLLYAPPPSFPLTPEGYRQIWWESD